MLSLKEKITRHYKEDSALSWFVCLCAFLSNGIISGIDYTFGEPFGSIMKDFKSSEANVAWIGSVHSSVQLFSASFSSIVAKKFGFAPVITIGILISTTFLVISLTSPNVSMLTLHYGCLAGFGLGLIYSPCLIICSFCFVKRRSLATGLALCGSGIGIIAIAEAMNFFNKSYGWKGCVIVCASICPVNGLLAMAAYMLPIEPEDATVEDNEHRNLITHADRIR